MASEAEARQAKARHGDSLRRQGAHVIAIERDAAGDFFLRVLTSGDPASFPDRLDGVPLRVEQAPPLAPLGS